MRAVLISIKPKYCELIASGKKTVEVRKTRPKIDTPFKVYIYCTKSRKPYESFAVSGKAYECGGQVIGEFVCDDINYTDVVHGDEELGWYVNNMYALRDSCLDEYDVLNYCPKEATIFCWHISDLVIYDKPKKLSEFSSYNCSTYFENDYPVPTHEIKRPPQSWCYVEPTEKGGGDNA